MKESSKTSNPSAFPMPSTEFTKGEYGMSLRDYFAAKAMQALIQNMKDTDNTVNGGYIPTTIYRNIAKNAYDVADAMLKQREL